MAWRKSERVEVLKTQHQGQKALAFQPGTRHSWLQPWSNEHLCPRDPKLNGHACLAGLPLKAAMSLHWLSFCSVLPFWWNCLHWLLEEACGTFLHGIFSGWDSARKKGAQERVGSIRLGEGKRPGCQGTLPARVCPWPLITILSKSQSTRGHLHPCPPSLARK